ncbi:MAG TPA: hypothetical protein VIV65_02210, partial [Gemmatimonadaceae bacterium]
IINSKAQVTVTQKVTAYQYLGGYWALVGKPDSANAYFVAAVDNDPFLVDLDSAGHFAGDEQAAFARAKRTVWRIGIRPVDAPAKLDANSKDTTEHRYIFQVVSTHNARLDIEIVHLAADSARETFPSIPANDGLRDVPWTGLIGTQKADTGLYEFRVVGTDRVGNGNPITERAKFRINHVHAPFEDTLPDFKDVRLGGNDTLTSRRPTMAPFLDAGKGFFLGAVAGSFPLFVLGSDTEYHHGLAKWRSHVYLGVGMGLLGGITASWFGFTHKDDRAAVDENARRKAARAQFNAQVRARNDQRKARTILIIQPLAGVSG